MRSPLRHHNKNHKDTGLSFEDCYVCRRDQAVCQKKIRFSSWQEANEWVDELNVSRQYEGQLVMRYPCRWCQGWHMKTAKDKHDLARIERYRRKWRTQLELERRSLRLQTVPADAAQVAAVDTEDLATGPPAPG